MKNIVFEALAEAARNSEPVTLGIISGVKGSSPQKVGAKSLFYADGRIKGTLGGGCLEAEIQQRAIRALGTGENTTFDLLLDHDFGWDDGLICGGKVFGVIFADLFRIRQNHPKYFPTTDQSIIPSEIMVQQKIESFSLARAQSLYRPLLDFCLQTSAAESSLDSAICIKERFGPNLLRTGSLNS